MKLTKLSFKQDKETKSTIRYAEVTDGKPPIVGSLYVQKWALGDVIPDTLEVTISSTDAKRSK